MHFEIKLSTNKQKACILKLPFKQKFNRWLKKLVHVRGKYYCCICFHNNSSGIFMGFFIVIINVWFSWYLVYIFPCYVYMSYKSYCSASNQLSLNIFDYNKTYIIKSIHKIYLKMTIIRLGYLMYAFVGSTKTYTNYYAVMKSGLQW